MLGGPDSAIVDANVLSEKKKKRKEIHVVNARGKFFFFSEAISSPPYSFVTDLTPSSSPRLCTYPFPTFVLLLHESDVERWSPTNWQLCASVGEPVLPGSSVPRGHLPLWLPPSQGLPSPGLSVFLSFFFFFSLLFSDIFLFFLSSPKLRFRGADQEPH